AGRGGLGRLGRDALRERKYVLCDLTLTMTDNEWHPAVDGQYQSPPVGNDRVRDLAAEARLDVRRLDATGAVISIGDKLHFVAAVPELLGDLHEHTHVLEARDLERHEREDQVRDGLRLRAHVQDHGDVAKRQAPVDEDDGLLRELMQRDREVRRDGGPADATLWREERDDLAGLAYARGRRERVHRHRRSGRG